MASPNRAKPRRSRRASSQEYGIVGFVVLVCLALIALDASNLLSQRRYLFNEARQDTANLARSLAQHAGDVFRIADANLIGAVRRLEIDGLSDTTLTQLSKIMAARVAMFPEFGDWAITDAAGNCLAANSPASIPDCAVVYRPNTEFHKTHRPDEPFLGRPVFSPMSRSWVVSFSRRFNHPDGTLQGIVVENVSLDHFRRFFSTFNIDNQGSILLATRDGIALMRRPFEERNIGRDLHNSEFFRNYVSRMESGDAEVVSATDGVRRLNSFRTVEGYPLILSVALATEEVLEPWYTERRDRIARTGALVLGIGVLGLWLTRRVRKHRQLEDAFQEAAASFRLLAEHSSDLIVKVGPDMVRQYVSPASRSLLGYEPEELVGLPLDEIVFPEDLPIWENSFGPAARDTDDDVRATYRVMRKDGVPIWVEVNRRSLPNHDGYVIVTRDVTRRKEAEDRLTDANRQLEELAHRDGLTGLANRRYFDEILLSELGRARREGMPLSLVMIDVDHFKLFNDRYGHPAGDRCLQQIAEVLAKLPGRPGDMVARYGGEEMAIILPNTSAAGAINVAERARQQVRSLAIPHEGNAQRIATISLGVATTTRDSPIETPDALITAADGALYEAKHTGRDRSRHADGEVSPSAPAAEPARPAFTVAVSNDQ